MKDNPSVDCLLYWNTNIGSYMRVYVHGFFCVLKGRNSAPFPRPHSQWNLGAFFPNFGKKIQSSQIFFFFEDWDFHSVNTHKSYMLTFSFNLMAIVCVIANLFFIDQKWLNCALKQISQFRDLPNWFSQSERPSGLFPKLQKNPWSFNEFIKQVEEKIKCGFAAFSQQVK